MNIRLIRLMKTYLSIFKKYPRLITAAIFCVIGFLVYFVTQPRVTDPFNYFNYLADAFLHGRLYVTDTPFYFEELIHRAGKSYEIYPPFPAVLLMPFVAVWGVPFKQVFLSFFLGGLNISIIYLIMSRLTADRGIRIWMTILFGFGTIHWFTATVGSVWYFAQITSMTLLLLAVYCTLYARRPLSIGLLLGASYWSRLPTLLTLPFFIIMLSYTGPRMRDDGRSIGGFKLRPLLLVCAGAGIFVLLNFLYNYLRFGTPFDTAYVIHSISPAKEKVSPWFNKGLFSLSYIPYHLYIFFLKPPLYS